MLNETFSVIFKHRELTIVSQFWCRLMVHYSQSTNCLFSSIIQDYNWGQNVEEEEDLNSISTHRVAHTITESHMKRDNCHFHNPHNILLVINEEKKDSMYTLFEKSNFVQNFNLTKPQQFHEFFIQIFLTIFLVKSKLLTAKKSKTTTISRVFHPKKIDNFLGKSKLNFWTKNEDFGTVWFSKAILSRWMCEALKFHAPRNYNNGVSPWA